MNINKKGQLLETNLNEYHIEPDGTIWEHIFHHNDPSHNLFASTDSFATGVYKNEHMWMNFQLCNQITSNWEFLWCQNITATSPIIKYRWKQTVNPFSSTYDQVSPTNVTRITTSGYTNGNMGGFYRSNSDTYFRIANSTSTNWFGAVGAYIGYSGGIPGYPNTVVTTGQIDVYLRVDAITKNTKFYKANSQICNNFYEY